MERLLGCSVDIVRLREHMNAALHKRIEKEGLYVCKELVRETIQLLEKTLEILLKRVSGITSVHDFLDTENGVILLDSVCMKLIAVGESVKNLDKIMDKELLVNYPAVNWKDVMGMRDII